MTSRPCAEASAARALGADRAPLPEHRPGSRHSLAEEHGVLLHEVGLRERAVLAGLGEERWPGRELAELVAYLRYEVLDQAVTEERLLFPLARGLGTDTQVRELEADHVRIRDVTDQLAGLVGNGHRAARTVVRLLRGLDELLETHVRTEQAVLSAAPGVESVRLPFRCHLWFPITEGPEIDLDGLPREFAHAATLERLSRLRPGSSVTLRSSSDLQSLWLELSRGHPDEFGWAYLDEGPEHGRATITRRPPD